MLYTKIFLTAFSAALIGVGGFFYVAPIFFNQSKEALPYSFRGYSSEIAIVDPIKIKNEAFAFKSLNEVLSEESKKFQAEILNIETGIRKEYESIKLLKKEGKTSDEKLRQMKETLDQKSREIEKKILEKKEKIDEKIAVISSTIEETIKSIIQEIYEEGGFDIVLNSTVMDIPIVITHKNYLNITDDVVERLNKKLPKISLTL